MDCILPNEVLGIQEYENIATFDKLINDKTKSNIGIVILNTLKIWKERVKNSKHIEESKGNELYLILIDNAKTLSIKSTLSIIY